MATEICFAAPCRPVSINETSTLHWAARKRKLDPWADAVKAALEVSHPGALGRTAVQVTLPFTEHRRRDPHNYVGTVVKRIIDTLVRGGVWPDDTPDYVEVIEPILTIGGDCIIRLTPTEST